MSGLIYLASPYSHPDPEVREKRFRDVCHAAGRLMRLGLHIYSPIAHSHPIAMQTDLPTSWEFWSAYDEAIISRCSEVRVLTIAGWETSIGITAEIEIANRLGIPVTFEKPDVAS